jgi:hypothetical protein
MNRSLRRPGYEESILKLEDVPGYSWCVTKTFEEGSRFRMSGLAFTRLGARFQIGWARRRIRKMP